MWLAALLIASACGASTDDARGHATSADGGDAGGAASRTLAENLGGKDAGRDASSAVDAAVPARKDAAVANSMSDAGLSGEDGDDTMMCLEAAQACDDATQCCGSLSCDTTSLGRVCCGEPGTACDTENGEDCCRDLLCMAGRCVHPIDDTCEPPCTAPPALLIERRRLQAIGGSFLGICGDANHTYGFHVAAANLPADDYSLEGAANEPVCEWHAAAIDIGMDWPASRDWLRWLIAQIQSGELTGIAEVIGAYDGTNVRYWSDSAGWSTQGDRYTGSGHDTWTHVSIHRSTAWEDHGILAGWTATEGP